jgi:3-phenylpropionate/cinnamic acid dioxygenase small subunit
MTTTKSDVEQALGSGVLIEAVQSLTGADAIAPDHYGRGGAPTALTVPEAAAGTTYELQREVELLLYRQAALLDAKQWQAWIELFTDDGIYWMPATPEQTDWTGEPSVFAEDRWLMEVRAGRLLHPNAWSQAALWGTNHLVGNIIVEAQSADGVRVYSRFQMMELRREAVRHFGGSYRHTLVRTPAGLRIKLQRVDLMNVQAPFDYVIQAWV